MKGNAFQDAFWLAIFFVWAEAIGACVLAYFIRHLIGLLREKRKAKKSTVSSYPAQPGNWAAWNSLGHLQLFHRLIFTSFSPACQAFHVSFPSIIYRNR
jgi:hypothetical protein